MEFETSIAREVCMTGTCSRSADVTPVISRTQADLEKLKEFLSDEGQLHASFVHLLAGALEAGPRGWCNLNIVEVRPSAIHNLGVFAKVNIARNTPVGAYPGYKRSRREMQRKARRWPEAKEYVFGTDDGWYLDPTDSKGRVDSKSKLGGYIDTTIAFVNEPKPGQDTNIVVEDGSSKLEVLFVASRDINASEELLVDYGFYYDRGKYNG